jgi:ketosteroid isomerase-like protein
MVDWRRRRQVVVTLFSMMLASVAFGEADIRSEIEAANRQLEAAVAQSDSAAAAAMYTTNAQLLPAQSDFVSGQEAIGQFWGAVFESGLKGASLVTMEVEDHGDTAYEVGKFEFLSGDAAVLDQGKYVVIWKKDGDAWKLHRDIWTTSVVPDKP